MTATSRHAADSGLADLSDRYAGRLHPERVDIDLEDQVAALHQRLEGAAFDLIPDQRRRHP